MDAELDPMEQPPTLSFPAHCHHGAGHGQTRLVRASSTDLTFWTRSGVGWGGAQAGWMGRTGRWDARSSGVLEPEQGGGDVPPSLNYI